MGNEKKTFISRGDFVYKLEEFAIISYPPVWVCGIWFLIIV